MKFPQNASMTKISDYKCRIAIIHNDTIYKLLSLWYYRDGGYFVTDLWEGAFDYSAMKVSSNIAKEDGDGKFHVPFWQNAVHSISFKKPKISHHIDGTSHISGDGIVSWYEENWNPKGLSIKSFDLRGYNDGWPVFACSIRADSLWKFRNIPISEIDTKGSELLKKRHLIIPTDNLAESANPFYFVIEGYYIHKSHLPDSETMNKSPILYRKHPRFWVIQLCALQSPESSPYVFWISLRKEPCPSKKSFILSFWASPWIIRDDGNLDILTLMVSDDELPVERSSLNYTP